MFSVQLLITRVTRHLWYQLVGNDVSMVSVLSIGRVMTWFFIYSSLNIISVLNVFKYRTYTSWCTLIQAWRVTYHRLSCLVLNGFCMLNCLMYGCKTILVSESTLIIFCTYAVNVPAFLFNWRDGVCHRHNCKKKVFYTIINLTRALYAALAWREYLNSAESKCLQQLFDKAKRWNITSNNYDIESMFADCDITLFKSSLNQNHCLNHKYPSKQCHTHCMTMRPNAHNLAITKLKYQSARNSFINWSLYKYV